MKPDTGQTIQVEVVLAMPQQQRLVSLDVAKGTTIAEAIAISGLPELFEGFELNLKHVGIFGQKADPERVLQAGDRVEIYRPLVADPKEVRRQRAIKQGKT